jgi:hypothetical protein
MKVIIQNREKAKLQSYCDSRAKMTKMLIYYITIVRVLAHFSILSDKVLIYITTRRADNKQIAMNHMLSRCGKRCAPL